MSLTFPGQWRFTLPTEIVPISNEAVQEFYEFIAKVGSQTDSWKILELFKGEFATVIGTIHVRSSSESWAVSDLFASMNQAASNPPLFLSALYSGFEYSKNHLCLAIPDDHLLNAVLRKYSIPLVIDSGELKLTVQVSPPIEVPPPPPSLREEAAKILHDSITRSEELLNEGRGREAVQEMLWVLESLSTGFQGVSLPAGQVKGDYFNKIVRDLRNGSNDVVLNRVLEWCENLHGFLSSPTGGKVRHGLNINSSDPISIDEARLFCNLIRSYVGFLQELHYKATGGA